MPELMTIATAIAEETQTRAGGCGLGASEVGARALDVGKADGAAAHTATDDVGSWLDVNARAIGETVRAGDDGTAGLNAFDPGRWCEWKPAPDERVMPQTIAERFRPLREPSNLESYVRNLEQRDGSFAQELARRVQSYGEARSPVERDAALRQVQQQLAGKLGECVPKDALAPIYDRVQTQCRVIAPEGASLIDIRFISAKNPTTLGPGHHVAKGGNLSVESKTGSPPYLRSEVPHILGKQVPGHLAAGDCSLVLVSRDFYSMPSEAAVRAQIRDAGSYTMAVLPEKGVIDEVLRRIVKDRVGTF